MDVDNQWMLFHDLLLYTTQGIKSWRLRKMSALAVQPHTCNPALTRQKQTNLCLLQTSQGNVTRLCLKNIIKKMPNLLNPISDLKEWLARR